MSSMGELKMSSMILAEGSAVIKAGWALKRKPDTIAMLSHDRNRPSV